MPPAKYELMRTIVVGVSGFVILALIAMFMSRQSWNKSLDEWTQPAPEGSFASEETYSVFFLEIDPEKREEAVQKLSEKECVQLTIEEVRYFSSYNSAQYPNSKPFLVRALAANEGTGKYYVHCENGALRIMHGSLGSSAKFSNRSGLIAWLQEMPSQVYVEIHVAK